MLNKTIQYLKKSWYQILRFITPAAYTAFFILGAQTKNIVVMLILMGSALLGGAFFCGWLCPFGFTQEVIGKLARLLKLPRLQLPAKVEKGLRFLRYILFAVSMTGVGFVMFLQSPYGSYMGAVNLNTSYVTTAAWVLLGAFLALSFFVDRPFCRYVCPEGARYGIVSMARIFTIKRDEAKCVSCGKCDNKCPAQINVSKTKAVRNGQCINCFECISACPVKGTLSYGWAFGSKQNKINNPETENTGTEESA
ncbi:MAG: 4Fe-4S binding protein [Spirochaetales bacterium]|nr:4Fe-4S binding protein [Spirochaetales bacterium]